MGSPSYIWYNLLALWFITTVIWFIFMPVVNGIMDALSSYATTVESQYVLASLKFAWDATPVLVVIFSLIWAFVNAQKPNWESEQYYYG